MKQIKEVVVLEEITQIDFTDIIQSDDVDEILEYAKNNQLNSEQITQIKNRFIELKDLRAYSRFIIDFGIDEDIKNIKKLILVDDEKLSLIMRLPDMSPIIKYRLFSMNSSICSLMRLIGFYGEIVSKNANRQEIVQSGKQIFDDYINKVAKESSDSEFKFIIDMLNNRFDVRTINDLQISSKSNVLYNPKRDKSSYPNNLDELYKDDMYISLIIGNTSVVESLKVARKNRYSFKHCEAVPVEHAGAGVSRKLSK